MPKIIKKLTRKEIEARPSVYATSSKPEVRNDGNGLALLVYPSELAHGEVAITYIINDVIIFSPNTMKLTKYRQESVINNIKHLLSRILTLKAILMITSLPNL